MTYILGEKNSILQYIFNFYKIIIFIFSSKNILLFFYNLITNMQRCIYLISYTLILKLIIYLIVSIFLICKLIKFDFNARINKNGNSIIILVLLLSLARLFCYYFIAKITRETCVSNYEWSLRAEQWFNFM